MTAATSTLTPTSLTSSDLSRGRLFLEQTRDGLIGSTKMIRPAQWTYKREPERWSIAEIVEHVTAVQELVIAMIRHKLASAAPPPAEQDHRIIDNIVIHQIPSRLSKFPSPVPLAAALGKAEALRRYVGNCDALIEMLGTTPNLREHAIEAPPLKAISQGTYSVMDGYQWILAAAAHAERHTKQILEVIADDRFPE
jgi:DinB superfamily